MAYSYEKREVLHGNAYGFFSKISQDAITGDVIFAAPYEFTGLRAVSFEVSQDSSPYYADNVEHIRLLGAKTIEGSITTYQIRKQFLVDHLGKKLTDSIPPALLDTGTQSNFLFCYAETVTDQFGGEVKEWNIWTNVQASAGITNESATDEDAVEPKEIEIPVTASANMAVTDSEGKAVSNIVWRDDENGTVQSLVNQLFAETSPMEIAEFIRTALGTNIAS